ncbi:hypothetical protein ACLKA6_013633 [Drosophila palustris]
MRAISDWTMVIYYDMDPYWRDLKTFNSGISEFQYLCPEVNNKPTCDSISQHYRHLYDELQMANVLIQHTRKRRSPFDAVGNIANSLFGVLDSNYAIEIAKVIKKVQTNEEFVLSLLKIQPLYLTQPSTLSKRQGLHQTSVYDYLSNKLLPLPKAEESTLDHDSRRLEFTTTQ